MRRPAVTCDGGGHREEREHRRRERGHEDGPEFADTGHKAHLLGDTAVVFASRDEDVASLGQLGFSVAK